MDPTEDDPQPPLSDAAIVENILSAIMDQRLSAGAKLPESALCEAFECSRSQVRRILVVLAERGVVNLQPNRGAFVASPNLAEAREVFESRRAVERSIVMAAAPRLDETTLSELRVNAQSGARAEIMGKRGESIRLSGQFHLRIAEAAGNSLLTKFLEDLVTRTSLIIGLYGPRSRRSCSEEDHLALVEALASRDPQRAADTMERHLEHVEQGLDMSERTEEAQDLRSVFAR